MSGRLHSGDKAVIKPMDNYAFSITKTKGMASSHASYNLTLVNGKDIIYNDKNLVDDVYLVFHDDILPGDRMKIEVNRGYFDYKLTPLLKLPTIVKNVLEPEVIEKAKHPKKSKKRVKAKIAHSKKEVTKKISPVQTDAKVQKRIQRTREEHSVPVPALKGDISYSSPIGETFFQKFTKIFKELVHSLSFHKSNTTKPSTQIKETVSKKVPSSQPKERVPTFDDRALQVAASSEASYFTKPKRGITEALDDTKLKERAQLEAPAFAAPHRGIRENFDDDALQQSAQISKKRFTKPQEIVQDSQLPTQAEEKIATTNVTPNLHDDTHFQEREEVPTFHTPEPISKPVENIPTFSEPAASKEPVQQELAIPTQKEYVAPKIEEKTQAYPDTGYKAGYEDLDQHVASVHEKPMRQRVVEDTSLPQNNVSKAEDGSDKLIITKRIKKDKPTADPFAGRVLGRMDDRILGNGYNGDAHLGKLGVRVTKNSRPISAWIEVFKNGTKKRVKTFYTSRSRKTKKVKLPAGNYMLRATYRTRDAKQQKTIKNIHLAAGDNVNKSIAFHDGKLRVIARRGDNPLYVKIVVYKSGSHRRVTYDFSSRTSGIAQFSLASGSYDIEVLEHQNSRTFDDIHIRAGKTNTINADF